MLAGMNRQLRRAQAKLDEKADRERQKKKQARKDKVSAIRERRKQRRLSGAKPEAPKEPVSLSSLTPEERKKMPGRFSGAFMIATVFFIILQAAVPADEVGIQSSLIGAGFFLMFGYFSTLFLLRRGNEKAFGFTLTSGLALAVGVLFTRIIGPEAGGFDQWFLLMVGLGAVGVVAGAYLGRSVFNAGLRR